jgi:hypothetical protein
MFASALKASYHRPSTKGDSVAFDFLKRLNMGALACAMFVALALVSNGKDSETSKAVLPRAAKTEVIITPSAFQKHLRGHKNLPLFYSPSNDRENHCQENPSHNSTL